MIFIGSYNYEVESCQFSANDFGRTWDFAGLMMFGDIGIAAMIGGAVGLLSGYGFRLVNQGASE